MLRLALIVEGEGDVRALPVLVERVGIAFGVPACAPNPIKAGNAVKLRGPGQLERFSIMAASRENTDAVLVCVDLDDGCPAEWQAEFYRRTREASERFEVQIHICFAVREFESWLLSCIDHLRKACPEYPWIDSVFVSNPAGIRDAKGKLEDALGRRYREPVDQPALARKLDCLHLFRADRSFKKFTKSVTGQEYGLLQLRADYQL